jgi:hypothetical protein
MPDLAFSQQPSILSGVGGLQTFPATPNYQPSTFPLRASIPPFPFRCFRFSVVREWVVSAPAPFLHPLQLPCRRYLASPSDSHPYALAYSLQYSTTHASLLLCPLHRWSFRCLVRRLHSCSSRANHLCLHPEPAGPPWAVLGGCVRGKTGRARILSEPLLECYRLTGQATCRVSVARYPPPRLGRPS